MTLKRTKHPLPANYSDRIRQLRERLGLTQQQLADRMGVSFASVNRWENGQTAPTPLAWQRIQLAEEHGLEALAPSVQVLARTPTIEVGIDARQSDRIARVDFRAHAQRVRAVVEAERLSFGYLFNPAFATETALIDSLPHQWEAVYERMLPQPRLRVLLAHDPGAGKTIICGLYLQEMLSRHRLGRILIVPPAGLVGNWKRELDTLFGLDFRIVSGTDARAANPFVGTGSDRLIISVDTLAGDNVFGKLRDASKSPEFEPYDLVIFDEAHKLSAWEEQGLIKPTRRYRAAAALAGITDEGFEDLGWSCRHLILATATPHMGKSFPYYALWRLLEPEIFATQLAFQHHPASSKSRYFLRRTKEELVDFNGELLFKPRTSATFSFSLTSDERRLYDETTAYIRHYYNKARHLTRTAAQLAMSVFQRRLASSTWALLRSLDKRLERLEGYIRALESREISLRDLEAEQDRLAEVDSDRLPERHGRPAYVLDDRTSDEEEIPEEGDVRSEQSEQDEDRLLGGVAAASIEELREERARVAQLRDLAQLVYDRGEESKFQQLRKLLQDPEYRNQKLILFTEFRDTAEFLVRRLEAIGFTGQVAQIHGGMPYQKREAEVEFFRRPSEADGAVYLVATDAAGEGINLQFARLMVNIDIPWNPARLEQRMGRIHRYGQKHPVHIMNLVAGETREGRVLATLLQKLETIRKDLEATGRGNGDRVFDVVGQIFSERSLREYLESVHTDADADRIAQEVADTLSAERVSEIERQEDRLYPDGKPLPVELPTLRGEQYRDRLLHLLPSYVCRFLERSAPLLDLRIDGEPRKVPNGKFSLTPLPGASLNGVGSLLDRYRMEGPRPLTVYRPHRDEAAEAVFVRPGEPLFDKLKDLVLERFRPDALRGAVLEDAETEEPYLLHIVRVAVEWDSERGRWAEWKLVGLRHVEGLIDEISPERLLILADGPAPSQLSSAARRLAGTAAERETVARDHLNQVVLPALVDELRAKVMDDVASRVEWIKRGYDFQEAQLAARRTELRKKMERGDAMASRALERIRDRQRRIQGQREAALAALQQEVETVGAGDVEWIARALVVPASAVPTAMSSDAATEREAMDHVMELERARGAEVFDVSTPALARAVGLSDYPGFDILARYPDGEERAIEVKGRARGGEVRLSENEWDKAWNLREKYWLYVVYDCALPASRRVVRVQDPFGTLIVRARGGIGVSEFDIFSGASETE